MIVQYLGQAGFLFQSGDLTVVVDPYLSDSIDRLPGSPAGFWARNYPPPRRPVEMTGVDLVLCTHDHLDHADPETLQGIAAASPGCVFAGPGRTVEAMQDCDLAAERTVVLDAGRPWTFRDVRIEPVAAAHEQYEQDSAGRQRFLGFLLRWGRLTLYHAGDTVVTPALRQAVTGRGVDIAFLPINGGDDRRRALDVVGNMDAEAAAAFAVESGFGTVVPMHYDLYAANGARLADFVAAWERQPLAVRPRLKAFLPGERGVIPSPDL